MHARIRRLFHLRHTSSDPFDKLRDRRLPLQALIALVAGLCSTPLAPVLAATDYSCVQACIAHGRLYQDCVARCTSATPAPGAPQNLPPPIAPQTVPVPVAPATTPVPGTMQLTPPPPPTRTVQPPVAPPAQRPAIAPATPSAPTPSTQRTATHKKPPAQPVLKVNGTCLARCKDRGHLYSYCQKICTE